MDVPTEEIRAFIDREAIRDCLARLARGEDRRDAALLTASFWPDATVDFGLFAGSFADYLAWVVPGAPAIPVTQHVLGQSLIVLEGDTARVETHVIAYHRIDMGTEHRDACLGGRYLDVMQRRGREWRITRRVMLYDWSQDIGASVDWTQGLMGMAFSADHFTGRAQGDHSVTFFTQDQGEQHGIA